MAKKVTPQAKGRVTKSAKDQNRVRESMIAKSSDRTNRLMRSDMAAGRKEFKVNKVPTKLQEATKDQNFYASQRRNPRNRPNAKKK